MLSPPLRRLVLAPAIVFFGIMVAHALLETARDALFLAQLPPHLLAWAYLAIAVLAVGVVTALRRWAGVRDPRRMLIAFLVLAAIGTSILAVLVPVVPSLVFVLYVWTGLVATLVVPTFWTLLDRSLELAEAQRVFAWIGAGGVLGALVGSALAALLSRIIPPHQLVTSGAAAFSIATALAIVLAPRGLRSAIIEAPRADHPVATGRSVVFLRVLLVLGIVGTVVMTLGDLTFKRVVAERLPPEQLAFVFGTVYAGLNVIGLGIQVLAAPRLLARVGVVATLTILPVIIVATSFGFALTGATVAMITLKLGDGGVRHSMHRVATEILYLPLPTVLRDRTKPIIDALGQRVGQMLAALLVFASAGAALGARTMAAITAALGVTWLGTTELARRAYVDQFREVLRVRDARDVLEAP